MRRRERGEPRREHTAAAAAGEEEERRGEGERESQRITRRERERERETRRGGGEGTVRQQDSLLRMVVTLLTFHEDRSWLKAEADRNTRRRRGRRRPV